MYRVDVAYALITNEEKDKVLIVRNIHTSSWSLPGGSVEIEESWSSAAVRETKEETGFEVELLGICAVNECFFEEKNEHVVFVTFKAKTVKTDIMITRPHEIAEVMWVDLDEANHKMPYYKCGLKKLIESDVIPYDFQGKQTLRTYNSLS
ncbi:MULTISPECIES: NUDIX hydrolase [unclassified Paenibacillus]|uniref:NUDIX hydrolase n=1 Tax=unclassified Paenibacillus TaxID=185978 RepID=UPI00278AD032|nr:MULTISPECIES: NUDIX hydrolase [unclassified Paenibacillus]MDQ0899401.1 8-oxo-dGTP diphosphatase [Paenibacillus sp. V4I7]MDQ0914578.1 8-oxo-dGTP diphosphatase [Paenibacillus sp. V4I5]